ncbi:hypothetical protein AYO22_10468 [Fonsecaea multimorphosa]|nr:hypothetical protein AYO22_10468 [Fonsecaea multimorphosa]
MNDSAPPVSTLALLDKSPNHVCHICAKSFARRDVLRRHARHQHGEAACQKMSPRSRRKSCLRCALHKIKCTRESTCQECGKNGLLCQYNFEPSSKNIAPKECDSHLLPLEGDRHPPSSPKRPRLQLEHSVTSPELHLTSASPMQSQTPPSLENRSSPGWSSPGNREFYSGIDAPAVVSQPDVPFGFQTTTGSHGDDNDIIRASENHGVDSYNLFTPSKHDSELMRHPYIGLGRRGSGHMAPEHWGLLFDMEDTHAVDLTSRTTSESQMPDMSDGAFPEFTITPEDLAIVGGAPQPTSGTWLQARPPLKEFLEDREGLQNHKDAVTPVVADTRSPLLEDIYSSVMSGSPEFPGTDNGSQPTIEAGQSLALRIHRVLQQTLTDQTGLSTDALPSFPSSVQLSAFWDLYFVHFDKVSIAISAVL